MGVDVLGVDVMVVDVLGVDCTALISWENSSEQGKERMYSVTHPLQHLYRMYRLMFWKYMMERLAKAADIL